MIAILTVTLIIIIVSVIYWRYKITHRLLTIFFGLSVLGQAIQFIGVVLEQEGGFFDPISFVVSIFLAIFFYLKGWKDFSLRGFFNAELKLKPKKNNYRKKELQLRELKDKGLFSEEEYKKKLSLLNAEKNQEILTDSSDYKNLLSLKKQGLLTEFEFNQKVEALKKMLRGQMNDFGTERVKNVYRENEYGAVVNGRKYYYKSKANMFLHKGIRDTTLVLRGDNWIPLNKSSLYEEFTQFRMQQRNRNKNFNKLLMILLVLAIFFLLIYANS